MTRHRRSSHQGIEHESYRRSRLRNGWSSPDRDHAFCEGLAARQDLELRERSLTPNIKQLLVQVEHAVL